MTEDALKEHIRSELPRLPENQLNDLALVIERLVAALKPERIYVFGSQARGDAGPDSDFDLLVVVPSADEPGHRLDQRAYEVAAGPRSFSLDILVMPHEEFEWRSRAAASLPATVLREGRMLYAA